jgi:hypothetical protein
MYYVLFLPALVVLVVTGYRLFRLRRHDRVLQRFWEARRSALQFLQESGEELSPEQYKEVRALIFFLDDKIEHYDARKEDLFNLRKADLSKEDVMEALEFISTEDENPDALSQLYAETSLAMGAAFYAYTPFTILLPVALVVLLLAGLGVHVAKKLARTIYRYVGMILRDDPYRGRMRPTLRTGM